MTEPTPSTNPIEVTFRLPSAAGATRVCVAGDFNGWSRTEHPMAEADDGLAVTIALEPGRWYRYRYWVDDNRWENDWSADWYTPNAYGGDDSVVDLTDESPRVAAAAAAAGAAASVTTTAQPEAIAASAEPSPAPARPKRASANGPVAPAPADSTPAATSAPKPSSKAATKPTSKPSRRSPANGS